MGERIEHFLDGLAKPSGSSGGKDLRVLCNSEPHIEEASADDKNWAVSEPDPDEPQNVHGPDVVREASA